ncbi:MAG: tetratricopeptide repeat protein [Flavobacteriales bacterium]
MADLENFDVQELSDKVQEKFEENKNTVYIALAAIILVVGGFWWYSSSKEAKSLEANNLIWKQERNFEAKNFEAAINGDQNNFGYSIIADDYSGTPAGDIAAYNMGVGYLNMGKFAEAVDALEGVSFDDEIVGAIAKGALGDAYFELRDVDKAISNYKAAISHSDNDFTTPLYLKKLAIAHETAYKAEGGNESDLNNAIAAYTQIKEDYPTSAEAQGVDKFIASLKK